MSGSASSCFGGSQTATPCGAMVPLLGIGGPDVASKREAQSDNLDGFFQCSQCKASNPLRERTMKGCQAWCIADNNSYNALSL